MRPEHLRRLTYTTAFFITLHGALVAYINSSALARIIAENQVNLVYTVGFFFALLALILVPRLLKDIGDVQTTALFIILEIGALIGLAFFPTSPLFLLFFMLHLVLPQLLVLDMDVFLEHATKASGTGRVRGIFLTILNSAFVISPLITGFVLGGTNEYSRIYMLSAIVLVPAFIIVLLSFKHFKDPNYRRVRLIDGIRTAFKHPALKKIFVSNFILRSFFATMVIFMPLYLHSTLGLSWGVIGILFTVMLLPFVLFEYPLGRLADTRYGEKEILAIGFLIMGVATALIPFIPATSLIVWGLALFLTRVGASAVESMNDTYFFKQISEKDTETIAIYRMVEPFGYIITPLLIGLILPFIELRFIFLVLGCLVLLGIPLALSLKDTR